LRGIYLGDSYGIVKRFWSESLRSIAPLYAHPRFVTPGIREQYTAVTSIPPRVVFLMWAQDGEENDLFACKDHC
jgi:hypothetical protein